MKQNWHQKLDNTLPTLHLVLKITLFLLKITTLASFAILAYSSLLGKMPHWMVIGLSALTAYLGSFVIDGLLDKLLPFAASQIDKNIEGRYRNFHYFTRVVTLLLLVTSGTITWWLMPQAAEMATRKPQDGKYLAAIDSVNRRAALSLESMAGEIRKAQDTERSRVRQAERDGQRMVRDAIASGSIWQVKSYKQNKFSWLESRSNRDKKDKAYAAGIHRAIAARDSMVQAERKLAATLIQQRDQLQSTTIAAANQLTTTLTKQVDDQWKKYHKKVANITTVLVVTDIVWMILVLILAIAIWWVDGFEVKEEKTLIGVVFNAMTRTEQAALSGMESMIASRFSGSTSGSASPPPAKASGPAAPSAPYQPVRHPPSGPSPEAEAEARLEEERRLMRAAQEEERRTIEAERRRLEQERVAMEAERIANEAKLAALANARPEPAQVSTPAPISQPAPQGEASDEKTTQLESDGKIRIVYVGGEPTVRHTNSRGEVSEKTLVDVRKELPTFRARRDGALKKHRDFTAAGDKKQAERAYSTYMTNKANVELFETYEQILKDAKKQG